MATNLTGLLSEIGGTIGEMGEPGKQYVQTFRDSMAPDLNMDNPESMKRYGEYLRRNGKQEEAMAMMSKAQDRNLALRTNEGQAKIAAIADKLSMMEPGSPSRQSAMRTISELAQKYEIPMFKVQEMIAAQGIDQGNLGVSRQNANTNKFNADTNLLSVENQDTQFYESLNQDAYQFDTQMAFKQDELQEKQRMNSFLMWKGGEEVRQGDRSLTNDEARTEITRMLANEDITMGEFKRVIMGNEDARAADMHPIEMQLKEAQVSVSLANAGYTEAQTKDVLYELGFKRDTEDLREDALELQNDLTEQEIKVQRKNVKYIGARTKAVTAEVELGRDRYNLEVRRQGWDEGMDGLKINIQQGLANSQISLRGAQMREIESSINSTILRDELLVAKAEGEKISEAYKAAYSLGIDLNDPNQIANARKMFINTVGPEFAIDFDEAIQERIKVQTLIADTEQSARLRENAKPKTEAQLKAAGMSQQDIDSYKILTDPEAKNQYVATWAKRRDTPEVGGAPTNALMDIYAGPANRMRLDLFGWDFPFGMDGDAIEEDVALAMSSAAASGKTANEVWLAGLEATFPHLEEQGSADSVHAAQGYANKYGNK